MQASQVCVVFVHGFNSSGECWDALRRELQAYRPLSDYVDDTVFTYATRVAQFLPTKVIPTLDVVANHLGTFLRNETANYERVALIGHSQGGLAIQRWLARAINDDDAEVINKISAVLLFATPNNGSQLLRTVRKAIGGLIKNPQERQLRVLDPVVAETHRVVLERFVNSDARPVPVIAIAGAEDGIVPAGSAHGAFPHPETVPGDHFSCIRPNDGQDMVFRTFARLLERHVPPRRDPGERGADASQWRVRAGVDHNRLFGIGEAVEEVGDRLLRASRPGIVSIFGPGGAGKTTLAYEVAARLAATSEVDAIAWVSAKSSILSPEARREEVPNTFYWQDLLNGLATQLGLVSRESADIESNFERLVIGPGAPRRALLVVDNLEDVDDLERAVAFMSHRAILDRHLVLMTTRESIGSSRGSVSEVRWTHLPNEAARQFVEYLASAGELNPATADIELLIQKSGGNPLIIKLAVNLAISRSAGLGQVMDRLYDRASHQTELLSYLFDASVASLQARAGVEAASRLLTSFCGRDRVRAEDLAKVSGLEVDELETARAAAGQLGLLIGVDGNSAFTVHSALRHFVCDDPEHDEA